VYIDLKENEGAQMHIQFHEEQGGNILVIHVSGKLEKGDYEHFAPEFERLVRQHGKLRVLFDMTALDGWDAGAAWEDIKFDIKHFSDIERLAMIGGTKWQHGMAVFFKPFTRATVRYFDHANAAEARKWLDES
jgi:MFS superfamily sulfate permease-like transporter